MLIIVACSKLLIIYVRWLVHLIVSHPSNQSSAPVEHNLINYFDEIEIIANQRSHFDKIDYNRDCGEIHVKELRILVIVAEADNYSEEVTTGEKYSGEKVSIRFIRVKVQIETIESQSKGEITQGRSIFAQEEMGKNDERDSEQQKKETCA